MPSILGISRDQWHRAGEWLRPQTLQGKAALSLIAHLVLLFFLINGWWFGLRRFQPGSQQGTRAMVFYIPATVAPIRSARRASPPKPPPTPRPTPQPAPIAAIQPVRPQPDPQPESPAITAANDALGTDQVSIQQVQGFPLALPDLTGVGQTADVIVDVEIDDTGHVTRVRQRKGIGTSADAIMVATVEQWVFRPATRWGKPIGSRRQLHWRFDRRFNPYGCGWECFALSAD